MNPPVVERSTDVYISDYVMVSARIYRNRRQMIRIMKLLPYIDALYKITKVQRKVPIRFAALRGRDYGICWSYDSSIEVCIKKIKTKMAMIRTLAHELTHAEQFQSKRFRIMGGKDYWEGREYKMPKQNYASYIKCPWEIEAFKAELPAARKAIAIIEGKK